MVKFTPIDGTKIVNGFIKYLSPKVIGIGSEGFIQDIDRVNEREEGIDFKYDFGNVLDSVRGTDSWTIVEKHYVISDWNPDVVLEAYSLVFTNPDYEMFALRSYLDENFTIRIKKEDTEIDSVEKVVPAPVEESEDCIVDISIKYRDKEIKAKETVYISREMEGHTFALQKVNENLKFEYEIIEEKEVDSMSKNSNSSKIVFNQYTIRTTMSYFEQSVHNDIVIRAMSPEIALSGVKSNEYMKYRVDTDVYVVCEEN